MNRPPEKLFAVIDTAGDVLSISKLEFDAKRESRKLEPAGLGPRKMVVVEYRKAKAVRMRKK